MHKKALLAVIVLLTAHVAVPARAADVFNKRNKDPAPQTQQVSPPQQSAPVVNPQQPVTPQPAGPLAENPGSIIPGMPACSKEDAKLVLELDKRVLDRSNDNASPEERSKEAKRWQENLKSPESMKNFIHLYIRCAHVVAAQREAVGMGPGKVPLQP